MKTPFLLVTLLLISLAFSNCQKELTPDPPTVSESYEDSVKNGLWAYFTFNNGSFSDLSGKNHNMTGVNGIRFGYDTWGTNNSALEFDGTNDYAVIDSGRFFPEGAFTVSFLMLAKANTGRIFQKANFNDAKGASFGFGFDQDFGTQKLHYYVGNDLNICNSYVGPNNATILPLEKQIYPDAWYMITMQHNNGRLRVFINGSLSREASTPNPTVKSCTTAPFYLGMWWLEDTRHFAGKVDELRIYTRALSDNEIKYLYDRLPQ